MQPAAPENFHSPAAGSTPVIVYALIDTGADRFYMDEGLANAFSYHRAATINVMGGTGTLASQERPSIFSIDGHSEHYAASFVLNPALSQPPPPPGPPRRKNLSGRARGLSS